MRAAPSSSWFIAVICELLSLRLLEADGQAVVRHVLLDVADAVGAVVEDARGEHGVGLALDDGVDHVLRVCRSRRGDDRHLDRVGDGARQGQVVAVEVAVGVHAGDQQLAGAQLDDPLRPLDGVEAGGAAAAVGVDLPAPFADGPRVDGDDDALRAEALRRPADEHAGRRRRRC